MRGAKQTPPTADGDEFCLRDVEKLFTARVPATSALVVVEKANARDELVEKIDERHFLFPRVSERERRERLHLRCISGTDVR